MNHLIVKCSLLLAILALPFQIAAKPLLTEEKIAEIDAFVEERMAEIGVPGVSLALIDDGEIAFAKGYGYASDDGEPVTADTIFGTASVTKPVVATVILQLQEEGRLSIEDKVTDHLPWFRTADKSLSDQITIRQLLSHTSGFSTAAGRGMLLKSGTGPGLLENYVRSVKDQKLISKPGESFRYSNTNYQTLGVIIEKLDNVPFPQSITNRVFKRLAMNSSIIEQALDGYPVAQGYRFWFGMPRAYPTQPASSYSGPTGGMFTSAKDLAQFLIAFSDAKEGFISAESVEQSLAQETPVAPGNTVIHYGLGWFTGTTDDRVSVFHAGNSAGFTSRVGFTKDTQTGYVILTNAGQGVISGDLDSLTSGVPRLINGGTPRAPQNFMVMRIILGALLAIVLFTAYRLFRNFSRRRQIESQRLTPKSGTWAALRIAIAGVVIFVILFVIPSLFSGTFSLVRRFAPDMALVGVTASVVLACYVLQQLIFVVRRVR